MFVNHGIITSVIHCPAVKAIEGSRLKPVLGNNLCGTSRTAPDKTRKNVSFELRVTQQFEYYVQSI